MPQNDFLPFATAGGANVVNQATYAAASWRTAGFANGLADPAQADKPWRQASIWSTVLGLLLNSNGVDAIDDGTTSNLLAGLQGAIGASATGRLVAAPIFLTTSGTYTLSYSSGAGLQQLPAACKRILLEIGGAGAAGGGSQATTSSQVSAGPGGGGGAVSIKLILSGFIGQNLVIGAGGVAVLAGAGGNGGNTTFMGMTAFGGSGGTLGPAKGLTIVSDISVIGNGDGGLLATGGDINLAGGFADYAVYMTAPFGGRGGDNGRGFKGARGSSSTGAGIAATNPGSGGGGGNIALGGSGTGAIGGNGADGYAIIWPLA